MPTPSYQGRETLDPAPEQYNEQFFTNMIGKINRLFSRLYHSQQPSIINGSGPPSLTVGSVGNYYVDIQSHLIYGPKTSAGW